MRVRSSVRVGSIRAFIMILAALAIAGCPRTEPTGEATTPLSQTSTTPPTSTTPTTSTPTTKVTSPTGTTSFTPPTPTDQSGP